MASTTAKPTTKAAPRRTTRKAVRRPGRQHISDRRYYVQCAYRLTMAVLALVAFIAATH